MSFTITPHQSSARPNVRVRVLAATLSAVLLLALLTLALAMQKAIPGAASAARLDGDGLFNLTNVWKIHLTFTPEQWQAMEPKGGPVQAAPEVLAVQAVRVALARACSSPPCF